MSNIIRSIRRNPMSALFRGYKGKKQNRPQGISTQRGKNRHVSKNTLTINELHTCRGYVSPAYGTGKTGIMDKALGAVASMLAGKK